MVGEVIDIDVERARKQEKTQHAMEQGLVEVNGMQQVCGLLFQVESKEIDQMEGQGHDHGHQPHPDGHRQANPAVVDVAEHGGERDQNRNQPFRA